jgi:hypothetical protein
MFGKEVEVKDMPCRPQLRANVIKKFRKHAEDRLNTAKTERPNTVIPLPYA